MAMKCLACGAEMRLLDVRSEATTPFAIERRIFQCSSCRQSAQRLGFDRSRMPSPAITPFNAPAIMLQRESETATSVAKLPPPKPQRPVDWDAVVGKVSIALKEKRSEARAAVWAKTMEKLRNRQMALKERAVPARTGDDEFDRVWYGQCQGEPALKQVASGPERPQECSALPEGP